MIGAASVSPTTVECIGDERQPAPKCVAGRHLDPGGRSRRLEANLSQHGVNDVNADLSQNASSFDARANASCSDVIVAGDGWRR